MNVVLSSSTGQYEVFNTISAEGKVLAHWDGCLNVVLGPVESDKSTGVINWRSHKRSVSCHPSSLRHKSQR